MFTVVCTRGEGQESLQEQIVGKNEWRSFLEKLSREVLADESLRKLLPSDAVASSWLGYPPATMEEIKSLEERLGVSLPESYRSLLQISNGWRTTGAFIYDLLPTSQVGWFRDLHQDWIDAWMSGVEDGIKQFGEPKPITDEEYFVYGPEQDSCRFRDEYWVETLAISGIGDSAIFLLNPLVTTPNGEWEAWFFADWSPGATRYRSFWEMMQAELETLISFREERESQQK